MTVPSTPASSDSDPAIPAEQFSDALAALRTQFAEQLPIRLETIRAQFRELGPGHWETHAAEALHRSVHGLTGAAGTFGLAAISEAARELEQQLQPLLQQPMPPAPSCWSEAEKRLVRLEHLACQAIASNAPRLHQPPPREIDAQRYPLIHLVEDDAEQAGYLRQILENDGFRVQVFTSLNAFRQSASAPDTPRPQAVLMDMMFPEGDTAGATLIAELGLGQAHQVPVVFTSVRTDLPARLAAFSAGASRYLTKPIDPRHLCRILDELTGRLPERPYRILLVDDDPLLLEMHAGILRQHGMEVETVSDPLHTLTALESFAPDVLILDVYMPAATGPELAAVLREEERFAQLPILFLSAETDMSQQLLALNLGGDDFLVKPVKPDHLLAAVTARARRARQNQAMMRQLQQTLYEREREHLALNQHALVSITDAHGNITYANDHFCRVSGYALEELLGKNHRLVKSDTHPPSFYATIWQTLTAGQIWQGEICNRSRDGRLYWVEATITPFLDHTGRPYQYVSIRTDITRLKESERALTTHEERFRLAQTFARIGTWEWNPRTHEVYWSSSIGPLHGQPAQERTLSSAEIAALIHPDDRQAVREAFERSLSSGVTLDIEHRVIWPNGEVHWVQDRGAVDFDKQGQALRMLGVSEDIDARKTAELALAESENQLHEAQSLAHLGHWQTDLASGQMSWSAEIYRIFGCDPATFTPTTETFFQLVHPDDREAVAAISATAANHGTHGVEHRIVRPDGSIRYVYGIGRGEFAPDGTLRRLVGTVQDITERKEAEARLREGEERFAFAVEGAGDGVWDWDMQSHAMEFSANYMRMLGYAPDELPARMETWRDSVHEDDLPRVETVLHAYLQGRLPSYAVELRLRCKDGSYKWILCRGTVVKRAADGQPLRMIGIHTDIHARKQAEENLRLFQRICDSSQQAIAIATADGRVHYVNPAYAALTGYTPEEMHGRHFRTVHLDPQVAEDIARTLYQDKQPWSGTSRRRRKDGSEFMSANSYGLVTDALGDVQYVFNILYDMSAELARREELTQAKELAERANQAKSEFLSSMSHELRTPMNAIIGFAQMLEYDEELNADQQDNVQEILKAGRHLLDLINEVLDLAKIEAGRIDLSLEPVAVDAVLADCQQLIQPLAAKRNITLTLPTCPGLMVQADRVRLKQVLLNLLSNAVKYNNEAGQIRVEAHATAAGLIRLGVRDTGPGIPPGRQRELFQPFNRLGAESTEIEGTGIGLTITRQLVGLMGGEVGMSSEVGVGSLFWLELPGSGDPTAALPLESDPASAPSQQAGDTERPSHTVLCIDDNPTNIKLLTHMLGRRPNLQILSAHDPELGIELAMAHQPDLILLDINMPGMDGYQTLEVLRADPRLRHTPVFAVTANAMPRDVERGKAAGFAEYLTKPLGLTTLLDALDRHLQPPAPESIA